MVVRDAGISLVARRDVDALTSVVWRRLRAISGKYRGADGVEEVLPQKGARTHTAQEIAGMVLPGSGFHYAGHEVGGKTTASCCCVFV